MDTSTGLRELKKQRTRQAISDAAIRLFIERGFAAVSVADIAAAAEVSKPTLFKYFPSKEDLLIDRISDHLDEFARAVRGRSADETPLAALRRHTLHQLEIREPFSGLNDDADSLRLREMIFSTPSLGAHMLRFARISERELSDALIEAGVEELDARLAATQIIGSYLTLAEENWRQLSAGRTATAQYPKARRAAEHAFDLLSDGLTDAGV
ncbi:TetR/AcrR family transcriptional regulator [Microlunatus soli]|uniref:DNA-binding transcriptional regulator, AcrR family n=1 Tax=Microlunatus soli TaxID=630515 RepID=A0A1H1SCF6_9ACTN|nr:TetR family transcriptional regulator [Microlunatus soli]SDS45553.1 DNA-binding transcriptional regulator, AcrR family [Microlunatus soli]